MSTHYVGDDCKGGHIHTGITLGEIATAEGVMWCDDGGNWKVDRENHRRLCPGPHRTLLIGPETHTGPPSRLSDFDAGHCETCDGGGYYDVGYADGYREGHEDGSNDLKGTGIQPEPVRACGPYCGCNDTEERL